MRSKLKFCLLVALFITGGSLWADHPIYILLTHPRATATAFEKVMSTFEGLQVLHAPYLPPYLVKKYGSNHKFTQSLPNPAITFEEVTNKLFTMAKTGPVFFKESGYLLLDYLREHPELCKNPQIKIAFLVRDPAKSILSYYKKMPSVDESIVGHKQLWELFVFLDQLLEEKPLIVDSDELLKNPLSILTKLGKCWDLNFSEKNLQWESGYAKDWHLKDWYVEVANSNALGPYKGDVVRNDEGIPQYLEVSDEKDRARLQEMFKVQNHYYQLLLKEISSSKV